MCCAQEKFCLLYPLRAHSAFALVHSEIQREINCRAVRHSGTSKLSDGEMARYEDDYLDSSTTLGIPNSWIIWCLSTVSIICVPWLCLLSSIVVGCVDNELFIGLVVIIFLFVPLIWYITGRVILFGACGHHFAQCSSRYIRGGVVD
jgi:hypothetical protein